MFNIGIITDNNWDNFILIEKKLKKIDDEYFKIHSIYFKNIESIRRANNMTTLVIHNSNQLISCIQKMFEFVDLWLIFTNYVEYLTPCHYIMNKCFEYNLNFIIISEAFKNDDCINISNIFEKNKVLSFKKILKKIIIDDYKKYKLNLIKISEIKSIINNDKTNPEQLIEYNLYNQIYSFKFQKEIKITQEIKNKLKDSYNKIENKKEKIKYLYDKAEQKKIKEIRKVQKESDLLQFNENRNQFIQSFKSLKM